MCGIVGALVFEGSSFSITEPYLIHMRNTMAHRGPDGEGVWIAKDRQVGFGHRRLSIIDLSEAAAQPMCNEDESLWVSFNGEIYNHVELKAELNQLGAYRWKTDHSDTEVILHAFTQWGIDCVHKFRGMFAIALWDSRSRELWLIRDRMGIKPLYYSIHHNRIVFASEIKALLMDPEQERGVDTEALYHYLSFLTTPAPTTLFKGIRKLPNATWIRVRADGLVEEKRYWDVWDHTNPLVSEPEEEIVDRLMEELRVAVKLRKISDVPVGVFLSGGIDSSTNAILFSEGENKPISTFSIGYEGNPSSYRNELSYARTVADMIGATHHERLLEIDDLVDFLPEMVALQDEPIADPVCVPVYYVSKLARDRGVIVCQVGEGADELFCGYPGWQTMLRLQRLNEWPVPGALKQLGLGLLSLAGDNRSFRYEWLRRGAVRQPIFWGGAEAFTETHKRRVLSPNLCRELEDLNSWSAIAPTYERFRQKAWDQSDLNWMTYLDLNMRLPELLLMRVDKMSMGVGVEGRVPFLDHKFVELSMSIPTDMKFKHGLLKYILKKAVRGLLPDVIIDRTKQGFGVPLHEWFLEKLGSRMRDNLESFCRETDFLNKREVDRLLERGDAYRLWYLFNFSLWWKHYVAS